MKPSTLSIFLLVLLAGILLLQRVSSDADSPHVVVYTTRHYDVDDELFAQFEEQTGIRVKTLKGGADELTERIVREGENTPADMLITVDAGRLHRAQERGIFTPVHSQVLSENIPSRYRESGNHWFGLTKRARVIVYDTKRTSPEEFSTYEALAEDSWKGRVVVRSSENIYNLSLLASFIETLGEEDAYRWAKGMVRNMARSPRGNDRDQAKAVIAGEADAAILNTYYIGRMHYSADPEEVTVAKRAGIFFPNQESTGTHINISGAGIVRHGKNQDEAIQLLEYLSKKKAQQFFASANFEYPVHPEATPSELVQSWGDFVAQDIPLEKLGKYNNRAARIFDKVTWR
ncbi:Fe(3+) ABC transporter substrate-binding protein [Chitinivibrio alkaliphilus]|uniref:ABC transporter, substrate-binding protein n=1 Tax=Chitinivibrio alkaliphilus ACht1 TaxID=1313304 RepID=U7DBG0_9BACT|nr:Fe(3+) ABC transporter substrate-binding protein [Chitinivibrio alkaliphilus]ERP39352.1 ABC transporter, substrate-binding protein [Chitinivibrio alkaliphilus ACht1]